MYIYIYIRTLCIPRGFDLDAVLLMPITLYKRTAAISRSFVEARCEIRRTEEREKDTPLSG